MFLVFCNVMKKGLLFLSLLSSTLMAQTIGVEDAQNKALQFLQGQSQTRASQREVQLKLAYTSKSVDETYYYVFNNAEGGYVIMGGDEAAKEVLGYGETGSFDYARIPDNMRWWLSQYDAQISQAIREVKAGTNKVVRQSQTRAERADIPVMLTTTWGQLKPYNMQLPTSQSGEANFPVGCAATAAAQIMNYHRWPDTGVGSYTLDTLYYGHKFTADFENTHYDWEAMADTYEDSYSGTREEIAVGTLMYHVGVAINSKYLNSEVTSANSQDAASALAEIFRYNKGVSLLFRDCFNDSEWETIVYNELSAKRPVLYFGAPDRIMGHAFVCDGYKDGHWHINWGWNGNYNNYFLLTPTSTEKALTPDGTGTGGGVAGSSYDIDQCIVTGFYPDPDGNTQYKKALFCYDQRINNNLVVSGDSIILTSSVLNSGLNTQTFEVRFKLINVDDPDDFYQFEETYSITLDSYQNKTLETSFCISEGAIQGTTYQIIPFCKDENGVWQQPMKRLTFNYARFQIAREIEVTKQLYVHNQRNVCKDVFDVSFTIKNFTDSTLTCPLLINVYPADEENAVPVDYFDLSGFMLAPREEKEIRVGAEDLHYGDRMVEGKNYKLQLVDCANDTPIGLPASCSFYETLSISLTVPEMGWSTFAIPYDAEIPEGLKVYHVHYNLQDLNTIILEKVDYLKHKCAYLIHGIPGTYQFIGPALEIDGTFLGALFTHQGEGPLEDLEHDFVLDYRDGILAFYRIQGPIPIGKYEAYLKFYTSKDVIVIEDPDTDDPTSLNQIITPGTPIDSRIYDLNGRIISTDHKGILIRDGKVFIIRE